MNRFQSSLAALCFVVFMGALFGQGYTKEKYAHELKMAKVKAGCSVDDK